MSLVTTSALAGTAAPSPLLLWSTNSHLKFRINQIYRAGKHYVWCSPAFDGSALGKYAVGASQPPSSDPVSIYRALHQAVTKRDGGDLKITQAKKSLMALALEWAGKGEITDDQRDEIIAIVANAPFQDWKPLIYAIPFEGVKSRVKLVPLAKRASVEPEYIIEDLVESEFQIIEPWPC